MAEKFYADVDTICGKNDRLFFIFSRAGTKGLEELEIEPGREWILESKAVSYDPYRRRFGVKGENGTEYFENYSDALDFVKEELKIIIPKNFFHPIQAKRLKESEECEI